MSHIALQEPPVGLVCGRERRGLPLLLGGFERAQGLLPLLDSRDDASITDRDLLLIAAVIVDRA